MVSLISWSFCSADGGFIDLIDLSSSDFKLYPTSCSINKQTNFDKSLFNLKAFTSITIVFAKLQSGFCQNNKQFLASDLITKLV